MACLVAVSSALTLVYRLAVLGRTFTPTEQPQSIAHNMSLCRRYLTASNMEAKRTKVEHQLGHMTDLQDRMQWQSDFKWVKQDIMSNPGKLRQAKAALSCKVVQKPDVDK